MQRNYHTSAQTRRRTGGFTLLELLIAITIIGILAGLLLPAIQSARANARNAQCRTEIGGLGDSLQAFKQKFGDFPPSRITLYGTPAAWKNVDSDAAREQERLRSRAIIKRFWPQFSFDATNYPWGTNTVELRGAECLVFFLGGIARSGTTNDLNGFSNNPATPFEQNGTSRIPPFFEFNPGRLRTSYKVGNYEFQCYLDTLPGQDHPYIYASGNDGSGYEFDTTASPNVSYDVSAAEHSSRTNAPIRNSNQPNRLTVRSYIQSAGGASWNKTTFQIISPGADHQFGQGGVWNEETADTDLAGARSVERDNLTNFHNSTLAPN